MKSYESKGERGFYEENAIIFALCPILSHRGFDPLSSEEQNYVLENVNLKLKNKIEKPPRAAGRLGGKLEMKKLHSEEEELGTMAYCFIPLYV